MNETLIITYVRQRLSNPMRMVALALLFVFPLGAVALSHSLSALGGLAGFYAVLFAAGAVGQDVSSGTLQLLLARPVTRPGYLVSRWVAAALAAIGCHVLIVLIGTLIVLASGARPEALDVFVMLLEGAAAAFGASAVVVMLSTLLDGLGDVAALIGSAVVLQTLGAVAMWQHWQLAGRIIGHVREQLMPSLSFAWILQHVPPSSFELVSWVSTVTLALAIAIVRLNRRELSYAVGA